MLMELTPEQRDRIRQLLEQELREALRSMPADDAAKIVADRRQALADLRPEEDQP
jgi:hypothetical protein